MSSGKSSNSSHSSSGVSKARSTYRCRTFSRLCSILSTRSAFLLEDEGARFRNESMKQQMARNQKIDIRFSWIRRRISMNNVLMAPAVYSLWYGSPLSMVIAR